MIGEKFFLCRDLAKLNEVKEESVGVVSVFVEVVTRGRTSINGLNKTAGQLLNDEKRRVKEVETEQSRKLVVAQKIAEQSPGHKAAKGARTQLEARLIFARKPTDQQLVPSFTIKDAKEADVAQAADFTQPFAIRGLRT